MRWWKFNAVGAAGLFVQVATLGLLVHVLQVSYLPATVLAVEAAILHNFFWHCRWTWADRLAGPAAGTLTAFLRFQLTTGLLSIAGNAVFMAVLVGIMRIEPVFANLLAVGLCSLINFFLCDRFTFPAADPFGRSAKLGDQQAGQGSDSQLAKERVVKTAEPCP